MALLCRNGSAVGLESRSIAVRATARRAITGKQNARQSWLGLVFSEHSGRETPRPAAAPDAVIAAGSQSGGRSSDVDHSAPIGLVAKLRRRAQQARPAFQLPKYGAQTDRDWQWSRTRVTAVQSTTIGTFRQRPV
jgi:hypothetical protein